MFNALTRLQNSFGFFTTVTSFVALSIALLSLLTTPVPSLPSNALSLTTIKLAKGRPHYYSRSAQQYAHLTFSLQLDLSPLLTWNTKQLFVHVSTVYPSHNATAPPHRQVIWDAILPHALASAHANTYRYSRKKGNGAGVLTLEGQRPKYHVTDPSGKLAAGNASLEVGWNVQPWVGVLSWGVAREVGKGVAWGVIEGGVSEPFAMEAPEVGKEEVKTVKGGEGNRGKPA